VAVAVFHHRSSLAFTEFVCHAISAGSGSRRTFHSICDAGGMRRGSAGHHGVRSFEPLRRRNERQPAQQTRRRLTETAPVAAAFLQAANAPEPQHLAIEAPSRDVRRIGKRKPRFDGPPLGELPFVWRLLGR
jgi:hypothetical protein